MTQKNTYFKSAFRFLLSAFFILLFSPLLTQAQFKNADIEGDLSVKMQSAHEIQRTLKGDFVFKADVYESVYDEEVVKQYEERMEEAHQNGEELDEAFYEAFDKEFETVIHEGQNEGRFQVSASTKIEGGCELALECNKHHVVQFKANVEHVGERGSRPDYTTQTIDLEFELFEAPNLEDLYFKLDELKVTFPNLDEEEVKTIEAEMEEELTPFLGQWFHVDDVFMEEAFFMLRQLNSEAMNTIRQAVLNMQLNHQQGMGKQTIVNVAEMILSGLREDEMLMRQEGLTEEDAKVFIQAIESFLDSKTFYSYDVIQGEKQGYERSIFSPLLAQKNLKETFDFLGENLENNFVDGLPLELSQRFAFLENVNFSVWHQFNTAGVLIDLDAYFELDARESEEAYFKLLRFIYSQQVTPLTDASFPEIPENAGTLSEFLGMGVNQEMSYPMVELGVAVEDPSALFSDEDPYLGQIDAPITVVMFFNAEDVFSRKFFKETLPEIKANYIQSGQLKLVFRDFNFDFDKESVFAAVAAHCTLNQKGNEAYFQFLEQLMNHDIEEMNNELYQTLAKDLELDLEKFNQCSQGSEALEALEKDQIEAVDFGIGATPSFFVNGKFFPGLIPYPDFQMILEQELQ